MTMHDPLRGTLWTPTDTQWLALHYGRFPMRFITEHLKRTPLAVRLKVHRIRKARGETIHVEQVRA